MAPKNGNRPDGRIENPQPASLPKTRRRGKRRPNESGVTGVFRSGKKWVAHVSIDGKQVRLGRFDTVDEALVAREVAVNRYGARTRTMITDRVMAERGGVPFDPDGDCHPDHE